MLSQSLENSEGSGFSSISVIFPPSFKVKMFDSSCSIALSIFEILLFFSIKYSAVLNIRLEVRNRFLPAIFIEFPR